MSPIKKAHCQSVNWGGGDQFQLNEKQNRRLRLQTYVPARDKTVKNTITGGGYVFISG